LPLSDVDQAVQSRGVTDACSRHAHGMNQRCGIAPLRIIDLLLEENKRRRGFDRR
jgi:hypothetical protein